MFKVYQLETNDPMLGREYIADKDRNLKLHRVAGLPYRPGAAFILTADDAVVPFEVTGDLLTDPESGQKYVLRRFDRFGASPTAELFGGFQPYVFPDEETKQRFLLAAAEALLIFGWSYDGPSREDGFIRVDVGGRILTLGDVPHE